MFDVLGIGAYAVDYLCVTSGYPREDEKIEAETITVQGGGNAATACVAVARLGGRACYHGLIGEDENTRLILEELKRENVDISHINIRKGNNPLAFIIINRKGSTRTIVYSKQSIPSFKAKDVNIETIREAKVLLIDFYYEEAALRASETAKNAGIPVVLDAERVTPYSSDIMRNTTHVIASKNFALEYTGCSQNKDMSHVLDELSRKTVCPFVCITLGENGVVCFDRQMNKKYSQRAFKIDVTDTTGAGDVFHGAFSLFLSRGYSVPEILQYSSACSAMKCRELGGRKGIPAMKDLLRFLESNKLVL